MLWDYTSGRYWLKERREIILNQAGNTSEPAILNENLKLILNLMVEQRLPMERAYTLKVLRRYWPAGLSFIEVLPIPRVDNAKHEALPPCLEQVALPEWAADLGINSALLVPANCISKQGDQPWKRVDWIHAAFWYLNGSAERAYEAEHGPIHSYSGQLKSWNPLMWERAWVNRIALFLRRWAALEAGKSETEIFGALPQARIVLTHDIDAIRKTGILRLKQTAFRLINALQASREFKIKAAFNHLLDAIQFALTNGDYFGFDKILDADASEFEKGFFFVYAGRRLKSRRHFHWLFDPSYSADDENLVRLLKTAIKKGYHIGLHASYNSWDSAETLKQEKGALENIIGTRIEASRQHWLRFSWEKTWAALEQAGITMDSTLGFNDRPGFRTGAALCYASLDPHKKQVMSLNTLPMVIMDSQFFGKEGWSEEERNKQITHWLDEIRAVRGEAAINWHTHGFSKDFGWGKAYSNLISGAY